MIEILTFASNVKHVHFSLVTIEHVDAITLAHYNKFDLLRWHIVVANASNIVTNYIGDEKCHR